MERFPGDIAEAPPYELAGVVRAFLDDIPAVGAADLVRIILL